MKPIVAPLLLSYILLFSTFAFAFASAATAFAPVLDTDGDELKRGAEYYVLPSSGTGGGLTLAGRNNKTCPLFVAKEAAEVAPGLPLAFFPFDGDHVVRVATDANAAFSASTVCAQSTVWRLGTSDGAAGRRYVGTGGVVGQTGSAARANWFRVEEFEKGGGYKFVFCPQPAVCRNCGKPLCGDLGLFVEGGRAWLGYAGEPFPVAFRKA